MSKDHLELPSIINLCTKEIFFRLNVLSIFEVVRIFDIYNVNFNVSGSTDVITITMSVLLRLCVLRLPAVLQCPFNPLNSFTSCPGSLVFGGVPYHVTVLCVAQYQLPPKRSKIVEICIKS